MDQFKTATIVPGDIKLEPGMEIALILYNGNNLAIAEMMCEHLMDCKKNKIPIPLYGTEFSLRVEDVEVHQSLDLINESTKYKIILKGELI